MSELHLRSSNLIRTLNKFLWPLLKTLFRIEVKGLENIPKQGSFLLIANHNAGALIESHSLLCLSAQINRKLYGLNHPALFKIPFVGTYFKKIGAITASKDAAHEALNNGHGLLIFPGGNRQALRPISKKDHHSFEWANGWADIASQSNRSQYAPVIPVKFLGTHSVNPIFFSNSLISKILVIPWILKIKWFPVSLAQIISSTLIMLITYMFNWPVFLSLALAYTVFLFTALLPIIPKKIKIIFYPPINSEKSQELSSQQYKEKMNQIMAAKDYADGSRKPYPFNGIEKFMTLHESENIHYNSQLILSFEEHHLDHKKILLTTKNWIKEIPHARTITNTNEFGFSRYVYDQPWFKPSDIVHFHQNQSEKNINDFCHKKFNLSFDPPLRIGFFSEQNSHKMIFSCHHSIFDGAGQALALQVWFQMYNNTLVKNPFKKLIPFRYRSKTKMFKAIEIIKEVFRHLRLKPPRIEMKIAHLNSSESPQRLVNAIDFDVPGKKSIRKSFYSYTAQAMDELIRLKGDSESPILFYLPTGLREKLKSQPTLQNSVITHNLFLKRSKTPLNTTALKAKINRKLSSDPVRENSKFFFGVLPLCTFAPTSYLQRIFKNLDSKEKPISCSGLIVNAPMPSTYEEPIAWKNCRFSARGTLYRSPSVGFILTGKPGRETITLEFVESLVKKEDILHLKTLMMDLIEQELVSKPNTKLQNLPTNENSLLKPTLASLMH